MRAAVGRFYGARGATRPTHRGRPSILLQALSQRRFTSAVTDPLKLAVKIRRVIFWIHLIAGVLASVVILIMSFTGVLLAYETQIINRAESNLRQIEPPTGGKPLSFDVLVDKARAAAPDSAPAGLLIRSEPTASLLVNFGREDVLYLNPYTGEVLGHGSKIRSAMQQIETWHRWVGAGESHRPAGLAVASAGNCVFLFLAVSGLYLWFPRSWSWNALRPSVWFVGGLRGKARDWNWHNTIGLWCSPVLIILTLTGVIMSVWISAWDKARL